MGRRYLLTLAVLFALGLALGCGGGGSSSSTGNPSSPTQVSTRVLVLTGSLAFGDVTIGSAATASLTISNSGNAPLSVSAIVVPTGFSTSWTSGSVPAGASQAVTVTFRPTSATDYGGVLTVSGDQTSGLNTISLSGVGKYPKAKVELITDSAIYRCVRGYCDSLTYPVMNLGPGCATNVQVTTRAYGSDGNGAQLGVDIPMGLPGGSLATFYFGVGTTVTLQSLGGFNDVRSAHTVFKSSITWTDVACR